MKIIISAALALLLVACGEEAPKETSQKVVKAAPLDIKKEIEQQEQKAVIPKTIAPALSKNGAQIYMKCAGCHGADASKAAMGKSQIIKGWDATKIENALNGYKDGSYGGAMKGLMKGQVSSLSAKEIKRVAEHISKF